MFRPRWFGTCALIVACSAVLPGTGAAQLAATTDDGIAITRLDLDRALRAELIELKAQQYAIERKVLRKLLAERLVEREANRRGVSRTVLERLEIDSQSMLSEREVEVALENTRSRLGSLSEEEARNKIRTLLATQKRKARRDAFVRELMQRAVVTLHIDPPRTSMEIGGDPDRGTTAAPVTVVVFSDFQCAACARVDETLTKLSDKYGERLRLVYKDRSRRSDSKSFAAALAARCAFEQKKYSEMRTGLFRSQNDLSDIVLADLANRIVPDSERFRECIVAERYRPALELNWLEAERHGVTHVPALFLNGHFLSGMESYEVLGDLVDEELQRIVASPQRTREPVDGKR